MSIESTKSKPLDLSYPPKNEEADFPTRKGTSLPNANVQRRDVSYRQGVNIHKYIYIYVYVCIEIKIYVEIHFFQKNDSLVGFSFH